jgi:hypothetical protein
MRNSKRLMRTVVLLGVLSLAVVAAPVQAKAPKAQKCQPHAVAYEVSGTVVSGSLTANSDRWSSTVRTRPLSRQTVAPT